jgi:hypothetical protein
MLFDRFARFQNPECVHRQRLLQWIRGKSERCEGKVFACASHGTTVVGDTIEGLSFSSIGAKVSIQGQLLKTVKYSKVCVALLSGNKAVRSFAVLPALFKCEWKS